MKKDLALIKTDDPEFIVECEDYLMLKNKLAILIIDVAGKQDNVRFMSRLSSDGYFCSSLLSEMNDKYHKPIMEMLREAGCELVEVETEKDFFNHINFKR